MRSATLNTSSTFHCWNWQDSSIYRINFVISFYSNFSSHFMSLEALHLGNGNKARDTDCCYVHHFQLIYKYAIILQKNKASILLLSEIITEDLWSGIAGKQFSLRYLWSQRVAPKYVPYIQNFNHKSSELHLSSPLWISMLCETAGDRYFNVHWWT